MTTNTFCVSGAVFAKAGDGVNTALQTSLMYGGTEYAVEKWIQEAESVINVATRFNWTDVYSTLNDDVKKILEETASCLAAIYCITYDMGGYSERNEAESMINVLRDIALRNISILRDKKQQDFINGT
jgi:hypothetical protein